MLDTSILKQVSDVFAGLENDYVLDVRTDASRAESAELKAFVNDFVSTSAHLSANFTDTNDAQLSFSLLKGGQPVGAEFPTDTSLHRYSWPFSMPMVKERTCPTRLSAEELQTSKGQRLSYKHTYR